jgi:CheY-like chemotaxis protein
MIAEMKAQSSSGHKNPVILTVDDDPKNLSVLRDCLVECNYTILVAEDGESAIQRADYARPDLILLDVMMPGIDGYETCRRLKALESTTAIPVIFMTALAETGHKVKGLESGAVDYITKPFQREELLARIALHLHNRELTRMLLEANETLERRVEERTEDLSIANRELEDEIAERQVAQEQLQEQAQILEEKIEELQLTQESLQKSEQRLRQSQKMEAIGTLAGGIAHDFNNILTAIIGYTDMAQRKITTDVAMIRDLERVQEAGLRAKELVRQILAFSRQGEQERQPVQVAAVIEEVFKLLRATLPTTIEIRQQLDIAPHRGTVLADPTQLHQVLMNLGTNAAHAMRDHGGALSVSLTDIDADASLVALCPDLTPGPYVRLSISDTGHGMDSTVMERIFDPYFTTKKVGEGTGMGLAVVQGIIKSHGGAISVYSEPGHGTAFHIFLPLMAGDIRHEPVVEESFAGGTERILFVDDEPALVELGQELLEALGYSVAALTSSPEALALFRAQPAAFDLLISDVTMPGLTGRELVREILAIRPDIPVIMCSGFTEFVNSGEAREAGISEFLMKPYVTGKMAKVIRKVLAGR